MPAATATKPAPPKKEEEMDEVKIQSFRVVSDLNNTILLIEIDEIFYL